MDALGDHGNWMLRTSRFVAEDNTAAKDAAVDAGWIGVTIPPQGTEWGIHCRTNDTLDTRAVYSLHTVLTGLKHRELPVRAGFSVGTGATIVGEMSRKTHNLRRYPDSSIELATTLETVSDTDMSQSYLNAKSSALKSNTPVDFNALGDCLAELKDLFVKGYEKSYEFSRYLGSQGWCRESKEVAQEVILHEIVVLENINARVNELVFQSVALVYGLSQDFSALKSFYPSEQIQYSGSPLLVAKMVLADYKELCNQATLRLKNVVDSPLTGRERASLIGSIESLDKCMESFGKNINLIKAVVDNTELSASKVVDMACFYAGHENGALYSSIKGVYMDTIITRMHAAEASLVPARTNEITSEESRAVAPNTAGARLA